MFIHYTSLDPLLQINLDNLRATENSCPYFPDLCVRAANFYEANEDVEGCRQNYFSLRSQGGRLPFMASQFDDEPADEEEKTALAHSLLLTRISLLIEDKDKQYLAYILNAIVRGALPMLRQIICSLYIAYPERISAYVETVSDCLMSSGAGVCMSLCDDLILLHAYHGEGAIAIKPSTMTTAVVPISTSWDGVVTVSQSNLADLLLMKTGSLLCRESCSGVSRAESLMANDDELLMAMLQAQCRQRVLLHFKDKAEIERRREICFENACIDYAAA